MLSHITQLPRYEAYRGSAVPVRVARRRPPRLCPADGVPGTNESLVVVYEGIGVQAKGTHVCG